MKPRSTEKEGYVYLIKDSQYYKIGLTTNPKQRLQDIRSTNITAEIVFLFETENMYLLEAELHAFFRDKRVEGEWFTLEESEVRAINVIARFYSELKRGVKGISRSIEDMSKFERELDERELFLINLEESLKWKLDSLTSLALEFAEASISKHDQLTEKDYTMPNVLLGSNPRVTELLQKLYPQAKKSVVKSKKK